MSICKTCGKCLADPNVCTVCTYLSASMFFDKAYSLTHIELDEDEAEEVKFELWCKLSNQRKRSGGMRRGSELAKVIGYCADTAIYLSKKRFENLDDYKVVLFNPEKNSAYITNNDVIIRLSDLPPDTTSGLDPQMPAYDYIQESFIPNPLPHSTDDLDQHFNIPLADDLSEDGYRWSILLPVDKILEGIHKVCPDSLSRRGALVILDIGYGLFDDAFVIPQFISDENGRCTHIFSDGKKASIDSHDSLITGDFIYKNTSYAVIPLRADSNNVWLNVYKEYDDYVTLGIYEILNNIFEDDIHPYSLASYAENRIIKFPIASMVDLFNNEQDLQRCYADFHPMAFELDYIYNVIFTFASFGYKYVNMAVKGPEWPVLVDGVRERNIIQPTIEAIIAPVIVGQQGSECENIIRSQANFAAR